VEFIESCARNRPAIGCLSPSNSRRCGGETLLNRERDGVPLAAPRAFRGWTAQKGAYSRVTPRRPSTFIKSNDRFPLLAAVTSKRAADQTKRHVSQSSAPGSRMVFMLEFGAARQLGGKVRPEVTLNRNCSC
jgi:hypothetical protein